MVFSVFYVSCYSVLMVSFWKCRIKKLFAATLPCQITDSLLLFLLLQMSRLFKEKHF